MQHLHSLEAAALEKPSVVTIGVFDGVHRGHQHLIRRLVEDARASDRLAVVITFFPHPDAVLRGQTGRYYLTTPEGRADLMGELGVDYVITLTFNDTFRHTRAAHFVDLMRRHLRLSSLWVGSDFAMGYQREGNIDFLRAQGAAKDFELHPIDLITAEQTISSSAIRAALAEGDVETANALLGRSYSVSGLVVHGEKRGRKIGFPTANIDVWADQVIPANGVYAGWALLNGERYAAVTNVGKRPTFEGKDTTVEAHLLDFSDEIYGEMLTFTFERYIRPEQKFSGVDALIAQIGVDAAQAREVLSEPS